MTRILLSAFALLSIQGFSQTIFWSESFGTGCNQGQLATAYTNANGLWSFVSTGTNAASASQWYVSATENGNEPGECGSVCGDDRTLHLGTVALPLFGLVADFGASYYEGIAGFCGILPCGATDKRVQSPIINCTGQTNITLDFDYIEGGNTIDNATLWYFNGSTWSQIADPAKTFDVGCSPQGLWTHYTIALPASANNNANVRIGFRWVNNEDGDGTDPSFAVDDIEMSVPEETGDIEPPVFISCLGNQTIEAGADCAFLLPDYTGLVTITDNVDPNPVITQFPLPGELQSSATVVIIDATDSSGNSAECTFTVIPFDAAPPQIECPENAIVELDNNCEAVVPDFVNSLSITDNCDSNPVALQDPPPGSFVNGQTQITIVVSDAGGNSSSCSFTMDVEDLTNPEINCPEDITVTATEAGITEIYVEVPLPATSDNCIYTTAYNNYNGTANASDVYPVGTTTVTWHVVDAALNENTCEMNVTVEPIPCCPADFDCNGVINVSDLLYFMGVC